MDRQKFFVPSFGGFKTYKDIEPSDSHPQPTPAKPIRSTRPRTLAPQRRFILPEPEMPYNTTAIPPRREPTGQAQLPLSRVKKIIALDQDINMCSNNAAFVITLATEMFIQYLAEQGHNVVKSERKPRRNIQYRDLAHGVGRCENLEFLTDIIPRTVPYKKVKENKAPAGVAGPSNTNGEGSNVEPGQTTLDGKKPTMNGTLNGFGHNGAVDDDIAAADPNAQLEMEIRGARTVPRTVNPDGTEERDRAPPKYVRNGEEQW